MWMLSLWRSVYVYVSVWHACVWAEGVMNTCGWHHSDFLFVLYLGACKCRILSLCPGLCCACECVCVCVRPTLWSHSGVTSGLLSKTQTGFVSEIISQWCWVLHGWRIDAGLTDGRGGGLMNEIIKYPINFIWIYENLNCSVWSTKI